MIPLSPSTPASSIAVDPSSIGIGPATGGAPNDCQPLAPYLNYLPPRHLFSLVRYAAADGR